MAKRFFIIIAIAFYAGSADAQIDLNKLLKLDDLLGKVLVVRKGFAPKFSIGNTPIPKIGKLGEILGLKQNTEINKLYRTFKTGRTKIASYAGSAVAVYGVIKSLDKAALTKDYQGALAGGLGTIGAGLITKFLTKTASYKAVDMFNGAVKRKIKDIFSVQPASQTIGLGVYVKL